MNGKGDKKRPMQISTEKFEANFEAIFGKKKKQKEESNASEVKEKPKDTK